MGWEKERVRKRYSRTGWLISEVESSIKTLSKVSLEIKFEVSFEYVLGIE
jgi:hypothetical protein